MSKYGSITVNNVEIELTSDSDFTNRDIKDFGIAYVNDGETYTSEFSAEGVTSTGEKVRVFWEFELVKGDEVELDTLDWTNEAYVTRVEAI